MAPGPELEIDVDLYKALTKVLRRQPTQVEPVLIVAAYVHSLAKGYGLSNSQHLTESQLGRANQPAPAESLIKHFLADSVDGELLRDRLYSAFVALSDDVHARRVLNENAPLSEMGLLRAAQILWNLEATVERKKLPIRTGQEITKYGRPLPADIKVPGANEDFATMTWTERTKHGATGLGTGQAHRSSGQGFRTKGARLAVLVAQHLVASNSQPTPSMEGAILIRPDPQKPRASIVWPEETPDQPAPSTGPAGLEDKSDDAPKSMAPGGPAGTDQGSDLRQILVGTPTDVGSGYQRRGFDTEIDRLWSGVGDRRVWLRGGPGLGKTYTARRVMQDAIQQQEDGRDDLLVWVDSADPQSVRISFSSAVDRMPQLGISVAQQVVDRVDRQARALLDVLARSTWRWLIVLDNADATALIETGLIPTGGNPNGRVLITTLSRDHRIASNGRVVAAELFTPPEAEAFLRVQLDPTNGRPAALARSSTADTTALAAAVGYHPLALSIAVATIVANTMEAADWITEFRTAEAIDATADEPDNGGYPLLIGATWRLALDKASRGLPDGVAQRTAMVAALQDPDGHPTWLWDRDAVTAWVADGAPLQRRHGVPVAVQRLIDNGILELRGNTWKQGRVAIHQLAARAVRELAAAATLAELASVLADEWLLQITDAESPARPNTLHSNLRPIAALPELPQATRQAAVALLGYQHPHSPQSLAVETESLDEVANYLRQGGATGLAELADQLAEIGAAEQSLGRSYQAHARYIEAAQIYRQLIDDGQSLSDDLRASYLRSLGDLEETLGRTDDARTSFAQAVQLYERLTETSTDGDLKHLVALVNLNDRLGNSDEKDRILARVDRFVKQPAATDTAGADTTSALSRGDSLWRLGRQFRALGRKDDAKDLLARAVDTYRQADLTMRPLAERRASAVLREMAEIHIETGHWHDAAECLTEAVSEAELTAGDSHVLLASVQQRLGQLDNVAMNLALAATHATEFERPVPPANEAADWRVVRDLVRKRKELRLNELLLDAWERGRWDDAVGLGAGVLEIAQKRAEASPGDHEQDLADAHQWLGMSFLQLNRLGEATHHLTRSAAISQMLAELEPGDGKTREKLADTLVLLGVATAQGGELEEATTALARSVGILQELADQSPDDTSVHRSLARALDGQARVHLRTGRSDDAAIECHVRRIAILQSLADQDPDSIEDQRQLADALNDLGNAYNTLGRPIDAIDPLTRAIQVSQTVTDLVPYDETAMFELSRALIMLGFTHHRLDNIETAASLLSESVSALQSLQDPDDHKVQAMLAGALAILGETHRARSHLDEAADLLTRSVNVYQLLADLDPGKHEKLLAGALRMLAEIQRELGRSDDMNEITARIDDLVRRFPELGN